MSIRRILPLVAVGCTTFSLIALEILSLRAAAVVYRDDFQFFIVPLTLAGIALGAIAAYSLRLFTPCRLAVCAGAYAFCAPLPLLVAHLTTDPISLISRILFFSTGCTACVLGGWIIASIISADDSDIPSICFFELTGAGFGALAAVLVLNAVGYEKAAWFAIILGYAPLAVVAFQKSVRLGSIATCCLILCGGCFIAGIVPPAAFDTRCAQLSAPLLTVSNSFAQVAVVRTDPSRLQELGTYATDTGAYGSYALVTDCIASETLLIRADSYQNIASLRQSLRSIPLAFWTGAHRASFDVLVPGAGAGTDIMRSELFGATRIDATEFDPLVVELTERFSASSTDPYAQKNVILHRSDTNAYLASSKESFDVVLDFLGGRSGDIAASPDTPQYGDTPETAQRLFDRVRPGGIFALIMPASERGHALLSIAASMLRNEDLVPTTRIVFIPGRSGVEDLAIVSRTPFTAQQKSTLTTLANERGFIAFDVDDPAVQHQLDLSITSLSDDMPYVYHSAADQALFSAKNFLFLLMASAIAGGIVYSGAVLWLVSRSSRPQKRASALLLLYSASLGVGFICYELWAMQKLFEIIGDPAYTTAITLASFLLWGGLGSALFRNVTPYRRPIFLTIATGFLLVYLLGCSEYVELFVQVALRYAFPLRALCTALFLLPPGILLGMYFPAGLLLAQRISSEVMLFSLAIDGFFSVAGGFIAESSFHLFGLHSAFAITASCYALACLLLAAVHALTRESVQ